MNEAGFERVRKSDVMNGLYGLTVTAVTEAGYVLVTNGTVSDTVGHAFEAIDGQASPQNAPLSFHLSQTEIANGGGLLLLGTVLSAAIASRLRHRKFKKDLQEIQAIDALDKVEPGLY
jgi:hypothetical protein